MSAAYFEAELRKILEEETERLSQGVLYGGAVKDFSDYARMTGQLAGVNFALDAFDEARSQASKR